MKQDPEGGFPKLFYIKKTGPIQDDRVYGVRLEATTVMVRSITNKDPVPPKIVNYGIWVPMNVFHEKIKRHLRPYCLWWENSVIETPSACHMEEKEVLGWVDDSRIAIRVTMCYAVIQIDNWLVDMSADIRKRVDELPKEYLQKLISKKIPDMHIVLALFAPSKRYGRPVITELVFRDNITSRLYAWTIPIVNVNKISEAYRDSIKDIGASLDPF